MTQPFIPLSEPSRFFTSTKQVKLLNDSCPLEIEVAQFSLPNFSPQLFTTTNLHFPQAIRNSVISRQAEYFATRYMVATLMHSLDANNFQLMNDQRRAPIWPAELMGSISHSENLAATVIGKKSRKRTENVGVDIQKMISPEIAEEVAPLVITLEELKVTGELGLTKDEAVSLVFSAKESIYKALNQYSSTELDFQSVSLFQIDNELMIFKPNLNLGRQLAAMQSLHCSYQYLEEYHAYVTACYAAW